MRRCNTLHSFEQGLREFCVWALLVCYSLCTRCQCADWSKNTWYMYFRWRHILPVRFWFSLHKYCNFIIGSDIPCDNTESCLSISTHKIKLFAHISDSATLYSSSDVHYQAHSIPKDTSSVILSTSAGNRILWPLLSSLFSSVSLVYLRTSRWYVQRKCIVFHQLHLLRRSGCRFLSGPHLSASPSRRQCWHLDSWFWWFLRNYRKHLTSVSNKMLDYWDIADNKFFEFESE